MRRGKHALMQSGHSGAGQLDPNMGSSILRIISRRALRDFIRFHSDAEAALAVWAREVENAVWQTPVDAKRTFNDVSIVGDKTVFNIAQNRYRLVAWVAYRAQKIFIKAIMTHKDYDKGDWK